MTYSDIANGSDIKIKQIKYYRFNWPGVLKAYCFWSFKFKQHLRVFDLLFSHLTKLQTS